MKTAKDYLTEANSVVERISPNEGIERYNKGNLVVVDVRIPRHSQKQVLCRALYEFLEG